MFQHAKKIQSKLYPNDFVIHIQNHSGSIRTHSEENGTHGWERGDRKKPKRAESCSKESRPELLRGQCQCISSLCKVHSSDWRSGQPSPITTRQTAMFPLLLPDSRCRGGGGGCKLLKHRQQRNLYSCTFPASRPLRNMCEKGKDGFHSHRAELSMYAGLIYKWLEKMPVLVHSSFLGTRSPNPEVSARTRCNSSAFSPSGSAQLLSGWIDWEKVHLGGFLDIICFFYQAGLRGCS